MPQTFNPVLLHSHDDIPNGPNSRIMRAVNCSLDIRKRVHTVMALEKKRYLGALRSFDHHAWVQQQRMRRTEERIKQKMKQNVANKQVFDSDNLGTENNYQRALNEKITERARRYREGVNQALLEMDPSYQRQQRAKKLLNKSKLDSVNIIQRNLALIPIKLRPLVGITEYAAEEAADEPAAETSTVIGFSNKETEVKTNQGIVTTLMVRKNTMYTSQTGLSKPQ